MSTEKPTAKLLRARAQWYREGCEHLEDREGYWRSGDLLREVADDLDAALDLASLPPPEQARATAEHLPWAMERVEAMASIARINAEKFGLKLLKGHGYPNEVMGDAQDALALETILAAFQALQQGSEQAEAIARKHGWQPEAAESMGGKELPLVEYLVVSLQDAEARARRPLEDAIKEQCSDCADGIAFDFDMGMHRKWPGVWQACTVPKWVHAALRARSRETPHDAQCESELTSHGYTPCRCAERVGETHR